MKSLTYALLSFVFTFLLGFSAIVFLTDAQAINPFRPIQGGTGTSNIPTYGQVLVGNSSGTYSLMSTSSLGISGAADGAFSTTSADYWTTLRNFFSTTSANYWETQQASRGVPGSIADDQVAFGNNTSLTGSSNFSYNGSNLSLTRSDSATGPFITLTQSSTGDNGLRFALSTNRSYILGSDNSDSDKFKISTASNAGSLLGTNDLFVVDGANSSIDLPTYNCSGNTNSGKLTVDASGNLVCADDISSSGSGVLATSSPWTAGSIVRVVDNGTITSIATSSLNINTDNLVEGSTNRFFSNAQVQTYLDTIAKGFFFSTTSADYWETQQVRPDLAFSTTSADHWKTLRDFFSTTSANYWETQQAARGGSGGSSNWSFQSGLLAPTSSITIAAPAFQATSTSASTTVARWLEVGSTNQYSNRIWLRGASDDYPEFRITSGNVIFRAFANGVGDVMAMLGTISNHPLFLATNNQSRLEIEADGDINVRSNSLNFTNGGSTGSTYKIDQTEDDFIRFQRSGGTDTNYSILLLEAPSANPTESTLTTMRNYGSGDLEFTDWFNQRYPSEALSGINVVGQGDGEVLPFTLRMYNKDDGGVTEHARPVFTAMPNTAIGFHVGTTTMTNLSHLGFYVGTTTKASAFESSVGIGTTSPYAKLSVVGETVASHFTATTTATSTFPRISITGAINLLGTFATSLSDLCVAITGGSGLCDGTDDTGGGGSAYPFPLTGNATSTLTGFNGGLTAYASSTIGSGAPAGGLTIFGNATTTGNAWFSDIVRIGNGVIDSVVGGITISGSAGGSFNVTDQVYTGAIDIAGLLTSSSGVNLGGSTFLEIPNGTNPTCNDPGEICHDTTDNQLIMDDFVMAHGIQKIWKVTIASTSPAFISAGLFPVPDEFYGYTITDIACKVEGGTSKVIAIEDASGNSTEDITCGTSVTQDDGSITNATATALEEMYIDFGATSGAVDYVTITVYGTWTRQ